MLLLFTSQSTLPSPRPRRWLALVKWAAAEAGTAEQGPRAYGEVQ